MQTYGTPSVALDSREYQENGTFAWTQHGLYAALHEQCEQDAIAVGRPQLMNFSFTRIGHSLLSRMGIGVCIIPNE